MARKENMRFEIRYVRQEEAQEAAEIEKRCFPPNEACTPERMKRRICVASDFFLVAIDPLNGKKVGFVNGIATQENKLRDEFFTDESLHDPNGPNIMILGVAVLPEYRGQGLARELISQYRRIQRERNRKKLVLTCLEEKVKMYEKFGFRDLGESSSAWGGETWHEMEAVMSEEFLTLMADLDDESQRILSGWYDKLREAGFTGIQTQGLPFHVSMGCFSLDKEVAVVKEMEELAKMFSEIPVHISHIGLFAGGKVLYAAPDMNPADLLDLRREIKTETTEKFPWTPHCTIMIDEAETIQKALPILVQHFHPFVGRITKLHLCAFWPTREIASVSLEKAHDEKK